MGPLSDLRDNAVSALLVSPHFTIRTAIPLLLGGFASAYGYGEGALGDLSSAYSAGALFSAFAAVIWAERHLRLPVLLGMVLGAVGLLTVLTGHTYPQIFLGFLLAGTGYGAGYSWMLSCLAFAKNPNRTLAWQWSIGTIPGMALLYVIPGLGGGAGGLHRMIIVTLLANLLVGLVAVTLPRVPPEANALKPAPREVEQHRRRGVYLAALALFAVYTGCTGVWSLLARVAEHVGLEPGFAGSSLSIAAGASCAVALMVARWGDRGASSATMTLGIGLMIAGLGFIAFMPGRLGYAVGVNLAISVSAYALTYCAGLIARQAQGAGSASMSAIALGAGAILGPAVAGHVYEVWGPEVMLGMMAIALLVGWVAYVCAADRRAIRHLSA